MRIQHNISALNSYRQMGTNNNALSKNLEKLSSGYRINRAGDDAAGLAISEKMRSQIKGLETAQKNANDGISLVQTAEGALTEVHSMLNRMTELATQSANGTYDNKVDRANLQKEVSALLEEIDRISESTNFNGINLLDGSLGGAGGASGKTTVLSADGPTAAVKAGTEDAAVSEVALADPAVTDVVAGDTITVSIQMDDGNSYDFAFEVGSDKKELKLNGEKVGDLATAGTLDAEKLADAVKTALEKDDNFKSQYTVTSTTGTLEFTANNNSFATANIQSASVQINGDVPANAAGEVTTEGVGKHSVVDITALELYDASSTTANKDKAIFTVNGQKFAFAKDAASAKALGSDVNVITTTALNAAAATSMTDLINQKLGTSVKVDGTTTTQINLYSKVAGGSAGGGLKLQIGDTADEFNKLTVSVDSMSAASLGIADVDISTQEGAAAAIDKIKNAINKVSSTRGDLGAVQNRLEHTINNLGVTTENITAAESRIRDTDMASEMMAYTKNNILIQASQAMLAQANQVPQGVLQLLQ